MSTSNVKREILSEIGIGTVVLKTGVKVVDLDKFNRGIERREVRTKTNSLVIVDGKRWTIGDNTYSFVKVSPVKYGFQLSYNTNMMKNKARISLYVNQPGKELIDDGSNRTADQVIEAFEKAKDVLLEMYGIKLQGVAEIVSLELNKTVPYPGDAYRLMQNLECMRLIVSCFPNYEVVTKKQNEVGVHGPKTSCMINHSWKLAHIRRSSMSICAQIKDNQEETQRAENAREEAMVQIKFDLQADGCSKYLKNTDLSLLTDEQIRNIYGRLYSDYVEAAMAEYKKKRMEEFQTKVKNIPKDRNGEWYCKLSSIIDNGHKGRCTPLVFSMDELLEGIDLLPEDNWIKIYRKKHKGKLLDRIQANVFNTYEEKESLQEVFDAFFDQIKPDTEE